MCDSITLNHLHVTYCTSMYGREILQHNAKYMSLLYVAWRKSIRIVFRLPSQTHNYIISNLGGCIIERMDRRLTKYIYIIFYTVIIMLLKQLYIVNYTCHQSQLLQITISIYHTNISYNTLTGQRVSVMSLIKLQFLQIPKVLHYVILLENYVKLETVQTMCSCFNSPIIYIYIYINIYIDGEIPKASNSKF